MLWVSKIWKFRKFQTFQDCISYDSVRICGGMCGLCTSFENHESQLTFRNGKSVKSITITIPTIYTLYTADIIDT